MADPCETPNRSKRRWLVSQCGAREHYAVPRSFHMVNQLRHFYTDAWVKSGHALLRRGPSMMRSMAGRHVPDLPSRLVTGFTVASARRHTWRQWFEKPQTNDAILNWELRYGRWFTGRVNSKLARLQLDPERDCFFGFLTQCLETLQMLRDRGIPTIVDQAAPGRVEDELVTIEVEKWPGWATTTQVFSDAYYERLGAEWNAASVVLVNSQFSKDAVVKQGVAEQKIIVVPLVYEPEATVAVTPRRASDRPLNVLWLGSVILRKGIQYLVEAAKKLQGSDVQFLVGGPIGISAAAVASAPANVKFLGRITRDCAAELYRQADIFVLPTVSDGFAITQLEAMAYGVPVITTPNCGQVVTHGVDGLIVPVGDAEALAQGIERLRVDRKLLRFMSMNAVVKSKQFTIGQYARNVNEGLSKALDQAKST